MSTSFRSRIKSAPQFDDIDNEVGTSVGTCCKQDGSKVVSTFSECSTDGGYFQLGVPEEVSCPEQGIVGCCCSCSYLEDFPDFMNNYTANYINYDATSSTQGVKDDVSLCQCNQLGGKWFYGKCDAIPSSSGSDGGDLRLLCGENSNGNYNDVRTPGACCQEDGTCTNICTAKECAALHGGTGSFNQDLPCGVNGQDCGGGFVGENLRSPISTNVISTCYELKTVNNDYTYGCSLKTEFACSESQGLWIPSNSKDSSVKCNDTPMYPPRRGSGSIRANPPTISKSKLPSIGETFQGGMYLGIFSPNDSSIEYRDRKTNSKTNIKSEFDVNGEKKFSWAVVLSFDFFGDLYRKKDKLSSTKISMKNRKESYKSYRVSKHDGFYNTHGNGFSYSGINYELFRDVKQLTYMGFNDWYIPAIRELSFIYKNISSNLVSSNRNASKYQNFLDNDLKLNMMSSSIFDMNDEYGIQSETPIQQVINTRAYVYGQYMNQGDNDEGGKIFVVDQSKPLAVPLCRRLIVTN